jgi:hypothetical protein
MIYNIIKRIKRSYIIIAISIIILYLLSSTRPILEHFTSEIKEYHFYDRYHYGDNILNLKFFYNISNILIQNNIHIHYYFDKGNSPNSIELERYVDRKSLTLHTMDQMPENAIELWMGNKIDETVYNPDFEKYYDTYYRKILEHIHIDKAVYNIDTSLFQNEPYLQAIYHNLDERFKDLDIFIINSKGRSGQFAYDKEKLDTMCKRLAEKYRIATTEPVMDEIPSTIVSKLNIQDIGAITTHAKYIIAVTTGPSTALFNTYTRDSVRKWIFLDNKPIKYDTIKYVNISDSESLDNIEQHLD